MSANDSTRIRTLWERHYNIQDTHYSKSRASSEPAIEHSLHDTVNAFTRLSISQSSQPLGTSSTVSTASTQRKVSYRFWQHGNLLWLQQQFSGYFHRQVHEKPTPGQQDGTHSIKLLSSVEPFRHSLQSNRVNLGTGLQNTSQTPFEPCQTTLGVMVEALKYLWWIFRWPVIGIATVAAVALIAIWLIATFYTLTSNAFLNSFCEKKLPLIRNMICSEYDSALKQMLQQRDVIDFNAEFGTMFEDKNIGTAVSLPYYLSNYQTELRWLRANLPGATLSESDEQLFRDLLTANIDLNKDSVRLSQKTFAHMHGTVDFIVSGTASVMGSLNETGFISQTLPEFTLQTLSGCTPQTLPTLGDAPDNRLAIGMEWLNSRWLVYLPYGIEPFQEPRGQLMLKGGARMLELVHGVVERLRKDQNGVLTVQGQIDGQIDLADRLIEHAVRCASNENQAKYSRALRGWNAVIHQIRPGPIDPQDWITEQRLQALGSMLPVYRNESAFLGNASVQLGSVLNAAENLEDGLFAQIVVLQRGMSPSDWFFAQPKVLEDGKEKLVKQLSVWNMRNTEVNARIFGNFG